MPTDYCSELPPGWAFTTLGEFVRPPRGKIRPTTDSALPFVGMDHIQPGTCRLIGQDEFRKMKSAGSHFLPGDVLYGRLRPYLNKVHVARFEGASSAEFIVLPSSETHDSVFLKYLLHQKRFVNFADDLSAGDRPRVDFKKIGSFSFALPPLAEQSRIASRVEELFSTLDAGEIAIDRATRDVSRYRKSILKAAVTGLLTADWRDRNSVAPATRDAPLAPLLESRRSQWEAGEVEKLRKKGCSEPTSPAEWARLRKRYVEPNQADPPGYPELPASWAWATVHQLASGKPRSFQSGPFGSALLHSEFQLAGCLVLGIDNVGKAGEFLPGAQNRISPAKFDALRKFEARPGDVLITVMASIGRTCVVPGDIERSIISKHVYRISVNPEHVCPRFLELALRGCPETRQRIFRDARGQTRLGLNKEIIADLPIPLPPLEEQLEIISRVDEAFSRADAAERALKEHASKSRALRHSILKAAFEGRLVPQDSSDEPAAVLLERIRDTRRAASRSPRRKTRA